MTWRVFLCFFFLSGIYAGVNLSRPLPGKFPHYVKSRPPKDSEKPGKGAKEWLTETKTQRDTSNLLETASNFEATRTIAWWTDHSLISPGEDETENHCFSQASVASAAAAAVQPKYLAQTRLLLSNDSSSMLLHGRSQRSPDRQFVALSCT